MQPFDKKFAENVKIAFENYEDDSAELGWEELRRKYPEEGRSRAFYFPAAAAAASLLLATWLLWPVDTTTGIKSSGRVVPGKSPIEKAGSPGPQKTAPLRSDDVSGDQQLTGVYPPSLKTHAGGSMQKNEVTREKEVKTSATTATATQPSTVAPGNQLESPTALRPGETPLAATASFERLASPEFLSSKGVSPETSRVSSSMPADSFVDAMEGLPVRPAKAPLSLSVYGRGFLTYGYEGKNEMNGGAGVSISIPFSRRISLSAGVGIAGNALSFSQVQYASPLYADLNRTKSNADALSATQSATGSYNLSNSSPLVSFRFRLTEIELPVAVQYRFPFSKHGIYLSGGLSSYIFAKERYSFNYQYVYQTNAGTGATATYSSASRVSDERKKFKTVNPFGSLNLAAGFSQPLGRQKLVIEPFIRLENYGLGYYGLKYNAAGLNLKYEINLRKN